MNNKIKIIYKTAVIIAMIFIALLFILYQQGYYDISFIKRPPSTDYDTVPTPDLTTAPPTTTSPNLSSVYDPEEITQQNKDGGNGGDRDDNPSNLYEKKLASILDASAFYRDGWLLTGDTYKNGMLLLKSSPEIALPDVFSYSRREVREPMRVEGEKGGYTTVMKVYEDDHPALDLYMGYIFAENGEITSFLSPKGELLSNNFNTLLVKKAYARDIDCAPLFIFNNAYYKYFADLNMLVAVEEENVRVSALSFDYQYSYGRSDGKIMLFRDSETGKWGYKNASGEVVIEAAYDKAYEFGSNKYASVVDNGVQKFIDRSGRVKINAFGMIYYNNIREVFDGYYPPDTNGIESLGMFYFDHGLVRVRRHLIDFYLRDMTADDMDILIDETGGIFPLPGGYTLTAYSNGVALLEKDGLYGYLDYTGHWIAQPIYTYAKPFSEGLASIGFKDGKKGMIDTSGNVVLPFIFDYVSSCSGGAVVTFEEQHGWQLFNKLKPGE